MAAEEVPAVPLGTIADPDPAPEPGPEPEPDPAPIPISRLGPEPDAEALGGKAEF